MGTMSRPAQTVGKPGGKDRRSKGTVRSIRAFVTRHSLVIGILLMFLMTWPIDLSASQVLPFRVPMIVSILVGYGFVLASLVMTALTLGRGGVASLLKRFLIWRVGGKWYLVAFLLVPFVDLLGIVLDAALGGRPIDFNTVLAYRIFGSSASLALLVVPYLLFDAVTNGEEIGWRGYVLPRLQTKYSALVSSLILGIVWGAWHLPKFLAPGNNSSFALLMVDTVAKAVILTWLYNNTGGSLLLTTLCHASWNTAGMFLPMANTVTGENLGASIVAAALLIVTVIVITIREGPARLSRGRPMQMVGGIS